MPARSGRSELTELLLPGHTKLDITPRHPGGGPDDAVSLSRGIGL